MPKRFVGSVGRLTSMIRGVENEREDVPLSHPEQPSSMRCSKKQHRRGRRRSGRGDNPLTSLGVHEPRRLISEPAAVVEDLSSPPEPVSGDDSQPLRVNVGEDRLGAVAVLVDPADLAHAVAAVAEDLEMRPESADVATSGVEGQIKDAGAVALMEDKPVACPVTSGSGDRLARSELEFSQPVT